MVLAIWLLPFLRLVTIEAVDTCLLISYSWTMEYCWREWHSAHLPVALTKSALDRIDITEKNGSELG